MKAWNEIAGDFEQDKRDPKPGEYSVAAVGGVGRVSCYRKGMTITDFYRLSPLLIADETPPKDQKPLETKPL